MQFRFFVTFATAAMAGIGAVVAAPAPNTDSVDLAADRRQLSSITSILQTATDALTPILSIIGTCNHYLRAISPAQCYLQRERVLPAMGRR